MIPDIVSLPHPVSQREHPSVLCGAITPLFTPERLDGRIDFDGLQAQADHLCRKRSVSSILIRSSEGAMWSYSLEETRDAIRVVLAVAKGRKPVIAGTAGIWDGEQSNRPRPAVYFRRAVDLSHWALAEGAAAVCQPVPTMLPPGFDYSAAEVVERFFVDVANAINGPVLIYHQDNLPVGYSISAATLARLSHLPPLMGVIYYTRDAAILAELVRVCSPRFSIISGCDSVAVPAFMSGAASSTGPLAALMPEVIDAAWQSLHEPNLPFAWRAQTDLLRAHEVLGPWPLADIGCALLAREGVNMAGRSRAARSYPQRPEVERIARELSFLRAAYMG